MCDAGGKRVVGTLVYLFDHEQGHASGPDPVGRLGRLGRLGHLGRTGRTGRAPAHRRVRAHHGPYMRSEVARMYRDARTRSFFMVSRLCLPASALCLHTRRVLHTCS